MSEPHAPSTLEDLLALEEIRRLKVRYCRFVDNARWAELEALFTPDARLEGFQSVPDGSDPAIFVAGLKQALAHAISIHHVHEPEIMLCGPDTARGIWPMNDFVEFPENPDQPDLPAKTGWTGWGYYEEEYARIGAAWRISYLRLVRQRIDDVPGGRPMPVIGRHPPRVDWI